MSVNKVILLGNLGKDPELKYTPTGLAVCNFSVATSEVWTDKSGQKQTKTEWHNVLVYGKLAETCQQYLGKGRQVYLEGALQTSSWDDKTTGQKRYKTEVNVKTVQFIGAKMADGGAGVNTGASGHSSGANSNGNEHQFQSAPINYDISADTNFTADDIPF